jgi:hypothetical protein
MKLVHGVMAIAQLALVAPPALACSVSTTPTPAELMRQAEVIVRARAEGLSSQPGSNGPGQLGASATQVEFRVVAELKGHLPAGRITFNGSLTARNEPNRGTVPYQSVRPSGDAGCFSVEYRQGAEYLLFLKRASHHAYAQPEKLTPYWAPLAPSNEQVFGPADPWERWVRDRLQETATAKPGTPARPK